jgi:hypothetical protein
MVPAPAPVTQVRITVGKKKLILWATQGTRKEGSSSGSISNWKMGSWSTTNTDFKWLGLLKIKDLSYLNRWVAWKEFWYLLFDSEDSPVQATVQSRKKVEMNFGQPATGASIRYQCCGSGLLLDRIRFRPFSTDQTGSGCRSNHLCFTNSLM